MTTATSYSKEKQSLFKTMYIRELKRNWVIGLLLFIGFVLCEVIPEYQLCSAISHAKRYNMELSSEFRFYSTNIGDRGGYYVTILMAVVLLMTTWFFRYLHKRRATDFYHSLPVTRREFYLSKMAAGLTLSIVPVVVAGILLTLAYLIYGTWVVSLGTRVIQILMRCVFLFAGWSIAGAVAVSVSTFIEMIGYTGALLSAGCMIPLTFVSYSSFILYGYSSGNSADVLLAFSPLPILMDACLKRTVSTSGIIITILWLLIGIALLYWGLKLYQKRESEFAGQWGRNIALGKFAKIYGGILIGFLFVLMGGIEGEYTDFASKMFLLLRAIAGMFVGYFIIEIITAKGVRTLKRAFPVPAIASIGLTLCLGILMSGGFGYENRVPKVEQVESVELSLRDAIDSTRIYKEDLSSLQKFDRIMYSNAVTLTNPEAIEKVINLHKFNVENRMTVQNGIRSSMSIYYKTKSGVINRSYTFFPQEVADQIKALATDPEVLEKSHGIYVTEPVHIEHIDVTDVLGRKTESYNLTDDKKQQLIEAVRDDLQEVTPEQIADFKTNKNTGGLTFVLKDINESVKAGIEPMQLAETFMIALRPSYTRTMALLEEWNMLPEEVSPELFTEMDICVISPDTHRSNFWKAASASTFTGLKNSYCYSIDDPELIKKVYENASVSRDIGEAANVVAFVFPSAKVANAYEYTPLYINNKTLLEIMDGRPEKMSYLLRGDEYVAYQKQAVIKNKKTSQNHIIYLGNSSSTSSAETSRNKDTVREFMEQPNTISVGTFFEQNMPQFLEGKSEAELKAMYHTPLEMLDGSPWLYNSSLRGLIIMQDL